MISINLEELQSIQTKMLRDLDTICLIHGIDYFIIGGTLIGAVRHKGFIPWDDDIDLAMTRDHYNKFEEIILKYTDKYFFQSFSSEENTFLPFGKLRLNYSTYLEVNNENIEMHKGIFIDIFPYDFTTKNIPMIKYKNFITNIIIRIIYQRTRILNKNLISKKNKILLLFTQLLKNTFLKRTYVFVVCQDYNKQKYVINYSFYKNEEVLNQLTLIDEIFPTTRIAFENFLVSAPKNYHDFLSRLYGNYMKIPPLSDRVSHTPLKVAVQNHHFIDKKIKY